MGDGNLEQHRVVTCLFWYGIMVQYTRAGSVGPKHTLSQPQNESPSLRLRPSLVLPAPGRH